MSTPRTVITSAAARAIQGSGILRIRCRPPRMARPPTAHRLNTAPTPTVTTSSSCPMLRSHENHGEIIFHAAADLHGTGVMVCGPWGAGKTTTLACLLRAGGMLLPNDRVILHGRERLVTAARHASRFRPFNTIVPKEMLLLGMRPALDHVIDECAGADEIIIVTRPTDAVVAAHLAATDARAWRRAGCR